MKTTDEIYQQMRRVFEEKTGYSLLGSCDMAVRMYAAAAQMEALYCYADWSRRQAFPQTADGIYLDYHGQMRELTRRAATCASGTIRFFVTAALPYDTIVPIGTVVTTADQHRFVTMNVCTIKRNSLYGDCRAQAEQAGSEGNVSTQSIAYLTAPPAGVDRCTNPYGFTGGADAESDEEFRDRILQSYAAVSNGGNKAFYEKIVRQYPDVAGVQVIPRADGLGTVKVIVASRSGIPTASMIQEIQAGMQTQREVAVQVTVAAPTAVRVKITLTVWPVENVAFSTVSVELRKLIRDYFGGKLLGRTLYLSALNHLIYSTGLVKNCRIDTPALDVEVRQDALPVLESLTVTEGK